MGTENVDERDSSINQLSSGGGSESGGAEQSEATATDGVRIDGTPERDRGDANEDGISIQASSEESGPTAGDGERGEGNGDESDKTSDETKSDPGAVVGEYTWKEFMREHGHGGEVSRLYSDSGGGSGGLRGKFGGSKQGQSSTPSGRDWDDVSFDPSDYLGFHPDDIEETLAEAGRVHASFEKGFENYLDVETTPVVKDEYKWEHFKQEYYYEDDGRRPRNAEGEVINFDHTDWLGFHEDQLEGVMSAGENKAAELHQLVEERTVDVAEELDEDAFFSTVDGQTTIANRYDLEKSVPLGKKYHFREEERYWVNKPFAYVVIFHSEKENEKKYYLIEPYTTSIEDELLEFLTKKLRTAIKYSDDDVIVEGSKDERGSVIKQETFKLLERYGLYSNDAKGSDAGDDESSSGGGLQEKLQNLIGGLFGTEEVDRSGGEIEGIQARPEPALMAEDDETLTEYQVEKLLYQLKRDFTGFERIDGIKHDINVEDISVDGYNSPVFVYHSDYEQIISNVYHGKEELDDFVVKLAQRSGKGISKRQPQVDATLPDGSRAQLTLGQEVSDHGTNYTIRQFKDVPFTPIDLINWNTFSLDEMAFLWLCIENHKSLIFAGGTASGKTTSLNAVSLFIPSSSKIVSIEDTREVELPQRNWIASVTRPSFVGDGQGNVDEFDLLEAALRQRPDYIVMGEIRGEEGRTLFQVMSTGHTTYTTFHADSVGEVLKRFTTEPINVSKTMFSALDLVSIQTQTRVQGHKVRRNKSLTEINHYDPENDEINVQDIYQWHAKTDEYQKMDQSNTLEEIMFDRGWSHEELDREIFKRQTIIAYLIQNGLNEYTQVAATFQAFINDADAILTLIANDNLEDSLENLREMESVLIDIDPKKEEMVPRPDPPEEVQSQAKEILTEAGEELLSEYRGKTSSGLAAALTSDPPEEVARNAQGPDAAEPNAEAETEIPDELRIKLPDSNEGPSKEEMKSELEQIREMIAEDKLESRASDRIDQWLETSTVDVSTAKTDGGETGGRGAQFGGFEGANAEETEER